LTAAGPDLLARHADAPDEEIVARVRAGEIALFEVLMRRYNQRLHRAVRAILRDAGDVEDAMQDAYLSAYAHLDGFQGRARFSTWLIRIGINHALDRRRKDARSVPFDPGGVSAVASARLRQAGGDPETSSAALELARLLEEAIDALPEPFRTVYVLREVEGLDTADAARCLGIGRITVKTRLHRARRLLQARLPAEAMRVAPCAFGFGAACCDRLVNVVLARLSAAATPPGAMRPSQPPSART